MPKKKGSEGEQHHRKFSVQERDVVNYAKAYIRRRYDVLRTLGHEGHDLDVNVGKLGLDPAEVRLFQAVTRLVVAEYADKLRRKPPRRRRRDEDEGLLADEFMRGDEDL